MLDFGTVRQICSTRTEAAGGCSHAADFAQSKTEHSKHRVVLTCSHLEDGLVLGLDALQEAWLREGKLGGGSLQVVVGLGLWHPLHKLRQVTLHHEQGHEAQ